MKKSSKAALLSGLIFPGIGHFFLREYLRGLSLIVLSLLALSVVVTRSYQQASLIVDQIASGNVPMASDELTPIVKITTDTKNPSKVILTR